ncbi:MAG: indole-3-glycerol phosphate synthase TrpC [Planctomycetaceae bacterium]|jgi:indole-3-glycerol phosphate synthase|nr:indole-3-glycerol phosphate synthase TrpC [Planctomycetaceae bacterium]MBT6055294.1 indole-3-glycerol phosphate synthase TrpC [Planctomycetaceae bacterium]MBT6458664.1 indole-3-glycerol phosphate synthase TrpC [Planctomycetaceae bacterium]MBT6643553.1 indole-3-glycerol phosphate synthase TrpC [Planctomycetaceae bacterium]MBT6920364.1 indole-3-glycerol phosphate synthase TrpC [Planctomycetaceae bacterium]
MSSVLEKIISRKRKEVAEAKAILPLSNLKKQLENCGQPRDFFAAVSNPIGMRLIAEFKRRSPSAGEIRPGAEPAEIARGYEQAGAAAISVLTDGEDFGGSLDDLVAARKASSLPVLRKEFIVDSYQVNEARLYGADAVLLIAECLDDCLLRSLYREVIDLGMTPLVELHSSGNLSRVLDLGATLIGVNNRDLITMKTDIGHVLRLKEKIPQECVLVAESGIRSRADVEQLEAAGVHAILVGESLLASPDPSAAAGALLAK